MFQIAVCDDEKIIVRQIGDMIKDILPNCNISQYLSGGDLLESYVKFDIIFLDIQMENMSGIETAKELRNRGEDTIIIFITGVKEYVFQAFDVAAFHYLVKPVRKEKLKEVTGRAIEKINKNKGEEIHRLFIKTRDKSISLNINDILFMESETRKIVVHTKREIIRFYGVMSKVEEKVGSGFYRCHRGYLVNMEYISEYDSENIYLMNGDKVYLAREKYQDFVKHYMRFLRNGGIFHV